MAEAYECDRCGGLYKSYDDLAPLYQYKSFGIRIMMLEKVSDNWPKKMDLCPNCMREIIIALKRKD